MKAIKRKTSKKVFHKSDYDTDDTVILDSEDTDLVPKTVQDKEVPDDKSLTLKRTDYIGEVELMLWLNNKFV